MLTVRTAIEDDLSTLLQFEQGLIAAERPFDPRIKREDTCYYDLPFMLDSDRFELAIAELDGVPVGCGYAKILTPNQCFTFDKYAYLGFMYTKPEYRGQGINKAVLAHLYDWSWSNGIYEIRLEVYPGNSAAIKAYEKAGMTIGLQMMRIDLREKRLRQAQSDREKKKEKRIEN
jgi:GNAT superfamily N-acetyltransferase